MWDPKIAFQDRTPPALKEAPRPIEERPICQHPETPDDRLRIRDDRLPRRKRHRKKKRGPRTDYLKALGFKTYDAYLSSALWQRIRSRIVLRGEGLCESCKVATVEAVHHIDYAIETLAGKNDVALLAVCKECHTKIHGPSRKKRKHTKAWEKRIFHWQNLRIRP